MSHNRYFKQKLSALNKAETMEKRELKLAPEEFSIGDIIRHKDGSYYRVCHNDYHKKKLVFHPCDKDGSLLHEHLAEATRPDSVSSIVQEMPYEKTKDHKTIGNRPLKQSGVKYEGRTHYWQDTGYPAVDKALALKDNRKSLIHQIQAEKYSLSPSSVESDANAVYGIAKDLHQGEDLGSTWSKHSKKKA